MRLSGTWFGNQELFVRMVDGEMRAHIGSKSLSPLEEMSIEKNLIVSRPTEALVTVQAGNATIKVMHDAFFKPYYYLNTEVRNLGSLGFQIGGVLGLDDHTVVAQKPADCGEQFLSALHNVHGSRASASLLEATTPMRPQAMVEQPISESGGFGDPNQRIAEPSGFGDPHMVNIMGEHFNIWQLGEVELLRIPQSSMLVTKLRFVAQVSNEDGTQSGSNCKRAPYMTAMRLNGSWFGNQELLVEMVDGEMQVHVGSKSLSP